MNPLLKIENLIIHFKGQEKPAVDGIHFSLEEGKILGIVGESGSGKSLTALSIMGLMPDSKGMKTKGEILFSGGGRQHNLLKMKEKLMRKIRGNLICMIFQEPMTSLNPSLKCGFQAGEQLRLHLGYSRKKAKKTVLEMFAKVKLPDPEKAFQSYPHQLSGGQRQRVMIAMAMTMKPKILIADEPTTALDVSVQKEVLDLIRDLQKENNTSVIFISHDLAVVKSLADDILVMKNGQVQEYGSAKDVFENPQSAYTKALLACRPKMEEKQERLLTVEDIIGGKTKPDESRKIAPDYNSDHILEVKNLNTWFPLKKHGNKNAPAWLKANEDIDFKVFKGETLGIVGESGSGKSTLIRSALQLIRPNSGEVIYNSVDLCGLSNAKMRKYRKDLQIIFQDPYSSLNPQMRIDKALMEPMQAHSVLSKKSERMEYVVEMLKKTGLQSDDLKKYPHQFSGGQRQRIVIARALLLQPKVVFCDESVAALDVSVQAQVLNLLNDLKAEFGLTYLFISHDLNVIHHMSDRILVMQKGKIVESGNSDEIIRNPQNEYTKMLIDAVPTL